MPNGIESQRHAVVFDCNVYLDVARLIGPPFSWEKFSATTAKIARDGVPHPRDASFDSLRAVALSTSGRFAAGEVLEVWTNDHIERLVDLIAQSRRPPTVGHR